MTKNDISIGPNGEGQEYKCTYADRYQVLKAPRCGCWTCEKRWTLHLLRNLGA